MLFVASHFSLITGVGSGATSLNAFDNSLQTAGVGNYNLLRVSSILPPYCTRSLSVNIPFGSLLPIAYSSLCSDEKGREITAAIGVGVPTDSSSVGVIMEFSDFTPGLQAEKQVEQMVKDAMTQRKIAIKEIICRSCSTIVDSYNCVFAAIALW